MIPIGDDNRDRRTVPLVTWGLIALNVFIFAFFQGCGENLRFTYAYSTVPAEILSGKDVVTQDHVAVDPQTREKFLIPGLQRTPVSVYLTILISMFMHAGIAHLLGNMLYLYIFGDNVEDRLGHLRFLLFYLFCGAAAALAQVYTTKLTGGNLNVPILGASGAISGVLGAYLLLFPRRRIRVLVFAFFTAQFPALVVVGLWFIFQLINGLGYLGVSSGGGVAYAAHIGGFIAGLFTVMFWTIGRRPSSRYTTWR